MNCSSCVVACHRHLLYIYLPNELRSAWTCIQKTKTKKLQLKLSLCPQHLKVIIQVLMIWFNFVAGTRQEGLVEGPCQWTQCRSEPGLPRCWQERIHVRTRWTKQPHPHPQGGTQRSQRKLQQTTMFNCRRKNHERQTGRNRSVGRVSGIGLRGRGFESTSSPGSKMGSHSSRCKLWTRTWAW